MSDDWLDPEFPERSKREWQDARGRKSSSADDSDDDSGELNALALEATDGDSVEAEVPERLVQQFLAANLDLLGLGSLKLVGLEYQVPSGRIDILAESADDKLFAIELKSGVATREAVGQLQSYIGDLLMAGEASSVEGCLVALDLDVAARSALSATPTIEFWSYRTLFTFRRVPIARPKPPAPFASATPVCPYCGGNSFGVQKEDRRVYCRKCGTFLEEDWPTVGTVRRRR